MLKSIRYTLLVCALLCLNPLKAQQIQVIADEAELDGIRRKGLSVLVELDKKFVDKAWVRKLRDAGKVDVSKTGSATVKPAVFPGIPGTLNATAYGRTDQGIKGTRVFLAVDLGAEILDASHTAWNDLKKFLYEFALQVYRDDLNNQIEEADKAVDKAVREHEAAQDEAVTVKRRLERNANDKTSLLRQLKENEAELYKLKADSVQNKIRQTTTLDEIARLRRIVEEKKTKLSGLE